MKKLLAILLSMFINLSCHAATQIKVSALDEFMTDKPSKTLSVRVLKESTLGKYNMEANSKLICDVLQIVDPKRGKRNATFFVRPVYYTENGKLIQIEEEIYGKYSKTVLSKEELKKIPPYKVMKNAALMVGNYFVKGLSTGVSFAEGFVKNEEHNRLKSGVVNAFETSPLSYLEEGKQLDIKAGEEFYLILKCEEDYEEPNYTYTLDK